MLLRGLSLELTMLKPVFDGKVPRFLWGSFFAILGHFRSITSNLAFDPKKHFLIRKKTSTDVFHETLRHTVSAAP